MGAKAISKVLGWTRTRDSASGLGRAIEGSLLIDARTCCKGCKYAFRIMTEMKFKPLCYANSTVICRWAGTLTSVSFRQVSGSVSRLLAHGYGNRQRRKLTWNEHNRLSSTLIIAPALSNSPQ